jgi:hypothetical protein
MMDTTIDGLASETVGRIDIDPTVSKNSAIRQKRLKDRKTDAHLFRWSCETRENNPEF